MSKLRLYGATSGYEEIKTADTGDSTTYQVGSTVTSVNVTASGTVSSANVTASGTVSSANVTASDTIQDAQGNVRKLQRNGITSTPYTFPSGSSGKYFSCNASGLTINIDAANIAAGEIFTFWAYAPSGDVTIAWTNMTNGVWIAGDATGKGTSGSVTLAAAGVCTVLCDASARMIFNGNVS